MGERIPMQKDHNSKKRPSSNSYVQNQDEIFYETRTTEDVFGESPVSQHGDRGGEAIREIIIENQPLNENTEVIRPSSGDFEVGGVYNFERTLDNLTCV